MDIDKLFLSSLNYQIKKEKGEDGKQHTIVTSNTDNEKFNLQNTIIDNYLALLIDKDENSQQPRSMNILHRSIDNDTKLAKDVLKYLEEGRKQDIEEPYGFYSLAKQTAAKNDYITGKIGIGPFALNNNNQMLTQLYHVKFNFNPNSIMSTLDLTRLDRVVSHDGTNILSWLSAMINAHVDIAKDPWISRLNVNPFTYNIVNLLFRTGFGANTLYFVNQPIMKMMAKTYMNAGATYMQKNGSKYRRQQEAIQKLADSLFAPDMIVYGNTTFKIALRNLEDPRESKNEQLNNEILELIEDKTMQTVAREYNQCTTEQEREQFVSKHLREQALMYLAYKQFDKYAQALSNLVKYCKIDTKKQGKSIAEQYLYERGYNDLFDENGETGRLFDSYSLHRLKDDSYIGRKTQNALEAAREILEPYFLSATPVFKNTLDVLLAKTGHRSNQVSADTVKSMSQAINAAIKSEYFNESAAQISQSEDKPNYLHDLVNASTERVNYKYDKNTGEITFDHVSYPLQSYIGKPVRLDYTGNDGKQYYIVAILTAVTGKNKGIVTYNNQKIGYDLSGTGQLYDGANTVYDRLARLQAYINAHRGLVSLQQNQLLQMLVPGKEFQYQIPSDYLGEVADTYEHAKFVKLQNFVEDGGINSNYIIDAWDDLLHYTNKNQGLQNLIRTFARDLVYYAFITSGDSGGFSKMFKFVPISWRREAHAENNESYSDFIKRKLREFGALPEMTLDWYDQLDSSSITKAIANIDTDDIIINNWYDNQFVPVYKLVEKTPNRNINNFVASYHQSKDAAGNLVTDSYPSVIGAIRPVYDAQGQIVGTEASIDPKNAPRFIKLSRHYRAYNSQRKYTIYKLHDIAQAQNGTQYPVYVKVNPKGNKFNNGFIITEYGRSDRPAEYNGDEYQVDEDVLKQWYEVTDFLERIPVYSQTANTNYINLMADLNRAYGVSHPKLAWDAETGLTSSATQEHFDDGDFDDEYMNHCTK